MTNLEKIESLPLPEEVKEQIKANIAQEDLHEDTAYYVDDVEDNADWLMMAFTWKDTPEGHDYWSTICKELNASNEI